MTDQPTEELDCDVLEYGLADTWSPKAPVYSKVSIDFENFWRLTSLIKSKGIRPKNYRRFIVVGYSLAVPLRKYFSDSHVSIVSDTTPKMAFRGAARSKGWFRKYLKWAFGSVMHHVFYKPTFNLTNHFFVLSAQVRKSLVEDYGVDAEKISIIHPPIYGDDSIPFEFPFAKSSLPVLLFIGNDLERKGGLFLINLFEKHLVGRAKLIILSSDKRLTLMDLPKDVYHISQVSHQEVYSIMSNSSLFLFPTYRDELGLVLSEALAMGLPAIARHASAQDEFVKDRCTGILLHYESDEKDWLDAIRELLENPSIILEYRKNSLVLASEILRKDVFEQKIRLGMNF